MQFTSLLGRLSFKELERRFKLMDDRHRPGLQADSYPCDTGGNPSPRSMEVQASALRRHRYSRAHLSSSSASELRQPRAREHASMGYKRMKAGSKVIHHPTTLSSKQVTTATHSRHHAETSTSRIRQGRRQPPGRAHQASRWRHQRGLQSRQ